MTPASTWLAAGLLGIGIGLVGGLAAAEDRPIKKVSSSDLKGACATHGGTYRASTDGSFYGCKGKSGTAILCDTDHCIVAEPASRQMPSMTRSDLVTALGGSSIGRQTRAPKP